MVIKSCVARLIAVASFSMAWGQQTNFNATFATAPPMLVNQFQLQEEVSVLMSAGNVYYDESLNCVPLQAYEITDQNGDPLGPYLMTTQETDSYVLDVTSLDTNCAPTSSGVATCKPYHRGQQLTAATDRGWRLDYYKPDAQTGVLWSTVMSGPLSQIDANNYELQVDLGLRWSEEGDNLNRLGQGQFSHIALAIGDFRSFSLRILSPGSALLTANVITEGPTKAPTGSPTSSSPSSTPTSSPQSNSPTSAPTTTGPTAAPGTSAPSVLPSAYPTPPMSDGYTTDGPNVTVNPVAASTSIPDADDGSGEDRETADDGTADRTAACSKGNAGPKTAKKCRDEEQARFGTESGCTLMFDKKGKGHYVNSKGKKCGKKGQKGFQSASASGLDQQSSLLVASTCAAFLISGWALMTYRQRQLQSEGYVPVDPTETYDRPPEPIVPTSFAAFGTFSIDELKAAAATMRLPPSEHELSLPNEATAIN